MPVTDIKSISQTEVIEMEERILDKAKLGEITEHTILYCNGSGFNIEYSHSDDIRKAVGYLEVIKHELIERMFK